jgi:hypothetical protein
MIELMKRLFSRLRSNKKTERLSPAERAQIAFEKHAKDQFKRLKEKGLGISVFSL